MTDLVLFWFRRDLRLNDNAGLYTALKENASVQPVFVFDPEILNRLEDHSDPRVSFLLDTMLEVKKTLNNKGSDLWMYHCEPLEAFKQIFKKNPFKAIYLNHDYEPFARQRDQKIEKWATENKIEFKTFKDQTLFEKSEILTDAGKPYTVYTPYKKKVLAHLNDFYLKSYPVENYSQNFNKTSARQDALTLEELKFKRSSISIPGIDVSSELLRKYSVQRDFPAIEGTSRLGLHLRFGTVSVRELAREAKKYSDVWLSELIWRDFFMQILWHFPHVEKQSFRPEYDTIAWRSSPEDFERWKTGTTGYPIVDAGMRELNATGHMHNRVRMSVASFLCKHLLIHWYQGERYFAGKLLDYDLSANNGNWQWAAGSGCDAAPYFRIFNPTTQAEKFDKDGLYISKWVPEWKTARYAAPVVDHVFARNRCLDAFSTALKGNKK